MCRSPRAPRTDAPPKSRPASPRRTLTSNSQRAAGASPRTSWEARHGRAGTTMAPSAPAPRAQRATWMFSYQPPSGFNPQRCPGRSTPSTTTLMEPDSVGFIGSCFLGRDRLSPDQGVGPYSRQPELEMLIRPTAHLDQSLPQRPLGCRPVQVTALLIL